MTRFAEMGLSEEKGQQLAEVAQLQNQLNVKEFGKTFPSLKTRLQTLHDFRQQTITAHVEETDGTPKAGISDEHTAEAILNCLRQALQMAV